MTPVSLLDPGTDLANVVGTESKICHFAVVLPFLVVRSCENIIVWGSLHHITQDEQPLEQATSPSMTHTCRG